MRLPQKLAETDMDRTGFDEALAALKNRDRPVLIEIKIDPDKVSDPGH